MADQSMNPGPPLFDDEPEPNHMRSSSAPGRSGGAMRWALAAIVVLLLAASAGLVLAWVVATMHAVPPPVGAIATPTLAPGATAAPNTSPSGTEQPRHTPTPAPGQTQEPVPFSYVVQRGDSVTWIATMFQVQWEDVVALNDLKPPKYRIFVGQELLIPGYGQQPPPTPTPKPRKTHAP